MQYIPNILASTYDCGAYGSSSYQGTGCSTTTTGGSSASSGGGSSSSILTNTGFDIVLIATTACVLIFAALIVRFWRRPKKQPSDKSKGGRV